MSRSANWRCKCGVRIVRRSYASLSAPVDAHLKVCTQGIGVIRGGGRGKPSPAVREKLGRAMDEAMGFGDVWTTNPHVGRKALAPVSRRSKPPARPAQEAP